MPITSINIIDIMKENEELQALKEELKKLDQLRREVTELYGTHATISVPVAAVSAAAPAPISAVVPAAVKKSYKSSAMKMVEIKPPSVPIVKASKVLSFPVIGGLKETVDETLSPERIKRMQGTSTKSVLTPFIPFYIIVKNSMKEKIDKARKHGAFIECYQEQEMKNLKEHLSDVVKEINSLAIPIAESIGYKITGIIADEDKFIITMHNIDGSSTEDSSSIAEIKSKLKCKYGDDCKFGDKCKFEHEPKPMAGAGGGGSAPKPYGDCKFGAKCNRKAECKFKHPESAEVPDDTRFCMMWQKGYECSAECKFKDSHVKELNPKAMEKFLFVHNKDVLAETLDLKKPEEHAFALKHIRIAYQRATKIGSLDKDNQGKLCRNWLKGCTCKKGGYYHTNARLFDESDAEVKPVESDSEKVEQNTNVTAEA